MSRLSASGLARAELCPGSAALPHAPEAFADAARGTKEHAKREAEGGLVEVAFAYDVRTGEARELGQRLSRNYPQIKPTEIAGTIDKLAIETDSVIVDDYKSGVGYQVTPARDNLQLAFYALCAARAHKRSAAMVRLIFTDQDDRMDVAHLDAFNLAETADRVAAIWKATRDAIVAVKSGAEPRVVSGAHCWRCPAIGRCPAHLSIAVAWAYGMAPKNMEPAELTPQTVADGWNTIARTERAIKAFKAAAYAYASHAPIALGNGKFLGEVQKVREELDAAIVRSVLRDMHGPEVADAALDVETSKTALGRAIGIVAPKGRKAKMIRDALAAIDAANGIKRKTLTVIEEFTPKESTDGVQGN